MPVSILPTSAQESRIVLGDTYRFLQTGAQTGGTFAFLEIIGNPGSFVPPHFHEREHEAFHILEGQVEVTDASGTHVAGPGDSIYLPKGEVHGWRVYGDVPARFYLHVVPAGIEEMFYEMSEVAAGPPDPALLVPLCARYGVNILPPPQG